MPWGYHTLGVELAQPPEQSRCVQCGRWSGQAGRKASPVRRAQRSEAPARSLGCLPSLSACLLLKALCSSVFCGVFFFKKTLFWEAVILYVPLSKGSSEGTNLAP